MSSEKWQHGRRKHTISKSHKQAGKFSVLGKSCLSSHLPHELCRTPEAAARQGATFSATGLAGLENAFCSGSQSLTAESVGPVVSPIGLLSVCSQHFSFDMA